MTPRKFHLGDILSVTTGKMLSPQKLGGVQEFLEFMAGGPVWTHQLGRVVGEARPVILTQYPELAEIDISTVVGGDWLGWLADQVATYGETLPLLPMSADQHEHIDPVSELAEKVHPDRIASIDLGADSKP